MRAVIIKLLAELDGSKHLSGNACDFYIRGVSVSKLLQYTKTLKSSGIINYTYTNNKNMNGVVHIDI